MVSGLSHKRLRFYFFRLRKASFFELAYRLREWLFLRRFEKKSRRDLAVLPSCPSKNPESPLPIFPEIAGDVAPAVIARVMNNEVVTLNQEVEVIRRFEKKWQQHFFHRIELGEADPDIRAVWEPARLQHLMILLQLLDQGACSSNGREIEGVVKENLLKWLEEHPFPYGPHYQSVMECGLRVPVFLRVLLLLDCFQEQDRNNIFTAIFQHGWLIRKRLSLYSSLGNHTVAECLGLVLAGALFRQDREAGEWLQTGIRLLEQECEHQILPDGGPAEQSFAYHRFVLDLYWLVIGFLRANNLYDCRRMVERVGLGESFLQHMQQGRESLPMIGDSDDGYAVGPGLWPQRCSPDWEESAEGEGLVTFPDSGYSLFRDGNHGLRVLFDHGRLGMEPLNNHGHADALAVFVSVGESDFLVDPGTYRYNGVPKWRTYFKGTSAHNTICVDGRDQARQLTGFIWEQSYSVEWRSEKTPDGRLLIVARHDGYRRQRIPVTHHRTVMFGERGAGECWLDDRFSGRGEHEYALHFHLHPEVELERDGNRLRLSRGGIVMVITGDYVDMQVLRGSEEPIGGWYSPAYGIKEPTTTVRVVKYGVPADAGFSTHIRLE